LAEGLVCAVGKIFVSLFSNQQHNKLTCQRWGVHVIFQVECSMSNGTSRFWDCNYPAYIPSPLSQRIESSLYIYLQKYDIIASLHGICIDIQICVTISTFFAEECSAWKRFIFCVTVWNSLFALLRKTLIFRY
jgi:hypothetical protein